METHSNTSSSRPDRKTIERNRRIQMKDLYSKLNSLLPHFHTSREPLTLHEQLDEAAKYVKKLQVNVEGMKERKRKLTSMCSLQRSNSSIQIQEMGPNLLHIVLVTSLDHKSLFHQIIHLLTQEGAEVVHAAFSIVDHAVFHTLQCKVDESCGDGAEGRIAERVKRLLNNVSN